ncbi:MAG: hypothetical protein ABI446_13630 [Gemmatimonadaceae bacterium]
MAVHWRSSVHLAAALCSAMLVGCAAEPPLVAGSADSYEFTARVRAAIPLGDADAEAEHALAAQRFDCTRTDTLQSEEPDTLQAYSAPDESGTEYITCDYLQRRHWGEKTRRRYLVVLYIREHRVDRVFAVTHLREVH